MSGTEAAGAGVEPIGLLVGAGEDIAAGEGVLLLPGEEVGFTWQLGPVKRLTHWHAQPLATVPTTDPPF